MLFHGTIIMMDVCTEGEDSRLSVGFEFNYGFDDRLSIDEIASSMLGLGLVIGLEVNGNTMTGIMTNRMGIGFNFS